MFRKDWKRVAEDEILVTVKKSPLFPRQIMWTEKALSLRNRGLVDLRRGGSEATWIELHPDHEPVELKLPCPGLLKIRISISKEFPGALLLEKKSLRFARQIVALAIREEIIFFYNDLVY